MGVKNAQNERELHHCAFVLDILALEHEDDQYYMRTSGAVEIIIRRLIGTQEFERLGTWAIADELELSPRGALLLPANVRTSVRKAVTDRKRLQGKPQKPGAGADA